MSFLASKPKQPKAPPPVPQIDEATAMRTSALNSTNTTIRRLPMGSTILTSETGLPDLGKTAQPKAGGY